MKIRCFKQVLFFELLRKNGVVHNLFHISEINVWKATFSNIYTVKYNHSFILVQ